MSTPAPIRYRVVHQTTYEYSSQVSSSRQIAHLTPRATAWQQLVSHRLTADPIASETSDGIDYFGNLYHSFFIEEPHSELIVRAESEVIVASQGITPDTASPPWEEAVVGPGAWRPGLDLEAEQYRVPSPTIPLLPKAKAYAAVSFMPGRPWLVALLDLTRRIKKEFTYDPKATTVETGVFKVLDEKRGVCQDYAHLMIASLRSLGIAARYVSGYVLNRPRDDGTQLTGADASHAWVAAHCPGLGWVAFDPTNGKLADQEFVTLGWGREFLDVTPLRGVVLGSASQTLTVAVSVTPIPEPATTAARA
jgi:transglutaminase-like putative cysteine protease